MKYLLLSSLLLSSFAYAQQDDAIEKVDLGFEYLGTNKGSGGIAKSKIQIVNADIHFGLGKIDQKGIVMVEVEMKHELKPNDKKKVKYYFHWNPGSVVASPQTVTAEIGKNLGPGLQTKSTSVEYGISPLVFLNDREENFQFMALNHHGKIKQNIQDVLEITLVGEAGKIRKKHDEQADLTEGEFMKLKSGIAYQITKKLKLVSYWEQENLSYGKGETNVLTGERTVKDVDKKLGTFGVGVKVNIQ